jgi:transposase
MERLRVQIIVDIVYRLRAGQSVRAICRDLGHSRKTIRRYRRLAWAKGYLDLSRALPEPAEVLAELGPVCSPPSSNVSSVEPYRELVKGMVEQGVEMVAIHLRLVRHHGYSGSYSSVRRFVHHLRPHRKEVVVRLESPPGQCAQVDFGGAGKMRDPASGRLRQAYCFVMTLAYSRHQYVEFVFDQKMETWIGCHQRAFESFGGVPRELVIDNLKAAVLRAALEDQKLTEPYRKLAQHYGTLVHPCRPRTPQHKGIAENGVHYVQRNLLAVEQPADLAEANRAAKVWVLEVAGVREHGTTHVPPLRRFYEEEQAALLALPAEPFSLREVRGAKVHRDCHVQVASSYYSAPFAYVGQRLDAYVYEHTVQLYDGVRLLVTHPRARRPGQRLTRLEHYPAEKSFYLVHTRDYCQQQADRIGPCCAQVVKQLLEERPLDRLRSVQGLLGLARRYSPARLETACARALHYGDATYRRLKRILAAGLDQVPLEPGPLQPELRCYEYARPAGDFFSEEVGLC